MLELSWIHLFILILASFRLTHLIVFDEITSFLRKPFVNVNYETNDSGQIVQKVEIKGTGWRYGMGLLLSCHWCIGIWSSLIVVALYGFLPVVFPLLVALAIAGAAAILESKV